MSRHRQPSGPNTRRFASYLRPVRVLVAGGLLASLLQAVMQWAAPWPLKLVFDTVLAHHAVPSVLAWLTADPMGRLGVLTAATLVIAAVLGLAAHLANRLVAQAGQRVVFAIRRDLFAHLTRQSAAFHQRRTTGDLMSRLDGDVAQIQAMTVDAVPTMVNNIATIGGMVVIMLLIDWQFAVVMLSTIPALAVLVRHYLGRIKAAQREALRHQGEAAGVAQEVLTSLTVVQVFGAEDKEGRRFGQASAAALESSRRAVVLQSEFTPLVGFTLAVATAAVVYLGARSVVSGQLTPGDVIVFMTYLRGIYTPVRQMAKLAGVLGKGHAAVERVAEVLDTDESARDPARPRSLGRARGALTFDDVSLDYPTGHRALDEVRLGVPAGTRLALVGSTGSGKSTLLRLVPRLLEPTSGVVRLDGHDIRDFSIADLRRQIALVPQEPYLFRAAIWENIAYGHPALDRDGAIRAARAAGLDEAIEALPHGFDTLVAERGASLSGGQRQCIAVARAMARNAPLLLLDEPTTGMDVDIEELLLAALDRVSADRTTITVSHQPSAIRHADRVAVIDHGRIITVGTQAELARAGRAWWAAVPRPEPSTPATGHVA